MLLVKCSASCAGYARQSSNVAGVASSWAQVSMHQTCWAPGGSSVTCTRAGDSSRAGDRARDGNRVRGGDSTRGGDRARGGDSTGVGTAPGMWTAARVLCSLGSIPQLWAPLGRHRKSIPNTGAVPGWNRFPVSPLLALWFRFVHSKDGLWAWGCAELFEYSANSVLGPGSANDLCFHADTSWKHCCALGSGTIWEQLFCYQGLAGCAGTTEVCKDNV